MTPVRIPSGCPFQKPKTITCKSLKFNIDEPVRTGLVLNPYPRPL